MQFSLAFLMSAVVGLSLANSYGHHYDHYPKHLDIKHVWKPYYHHGYGGHGYGHDGGHGYGHGDNHYDHGKVYYGHSSRYQTMKHSK